MNILPKRSSRAQRLADSIASYIAIHFPGLAALMSRAAAPRGRPAIAGVVALFLTLVVAGAMLMIGYFVIAMIQNAIPTSTLNTAENSNLTSLEGNVSSAFLLAGIALIAIGAGGVIYSLVSSFGFGGGNQ